MSPDEKPEPPKTEKKADVPALKPADVKKTPPAAKPAVKKEEKPKAGGFWRGIGRLFGVPNSPAPAKPSAAPAKAAPPVSAPAAGKPPEQKKESAVPKTASAPEPVSKEPKEPVAKVPPPYPEKLPPSSPTTPSIAPAGPGPAAPVLKETAAAPKEPAPVKPPAPAPVSTPTLVLGDSREKAWMLEKSALLTDIERLKEKNRLLQDKLDHHAEARENLEQDSAQSKDSLRNTGEVIKSLESSLYRERTKAQDLENEKVLLKKQYQQVYADQEKNNQRLQDALTAEVRSLKARIREDEQKLEAAAFEVAKVREMLAAAKQAKPAPAAGQDALLKEIDDLLAERAGLSDELKFLKAKLKG